NRDGSHVDSHIQNWNRRRNIQSVSKSKRGHCSKLVRLQVNSILSSYVVFRNDWRTGAIDTSDIVGVRRRTVLRFVLKNSRETAQIHSINFIEIEMLVTESKK